MLPAQQATLIEGINPRRAKRNQRPYLGKRLVIVVSTSGSACKRDGRIGDRCADASRLRHSQVNRPRRRMNGASRYLRENAATTKLAARTTMERASSAPCAPNVNTSLIARRCNIQ